MLSISNVSSGQGASYYSKDDYYLVNDGQWQGHLGHLMVVTETQIQPETFNHFMNEKGAIQGFTVQMKVPPEIMEHLPADPEKCSEILQEFEAVQIRVNNQIHALEEQGKLQFHRIEYQKKVRTSGGKSDSLDRFIKLQLDKEDQGDGLQYRDDRRILQHRKTLADQYRNDLHEILLARGLDLAKQGRGEYLSIETRDIPRRGFDLTFSAPKSVSIAMALSPELREMVTRLHQEAIQHTLEYVEENLIYAHMKVDGKTVNPQSDNMLAAKFTHYVSRNQDPQLHSHCVIINKTHHAGKERALWETPLYQNKMLLGQMYRNQLAAGLRKAGLDIRITDPRKGLFELEGVPQEALERFSSRRKEILAQLETWKTSGAVAASHAATLTRQAKENRNLDLLIESWKADLADFQLDIHPDLAGFRITPEQMNKVFERVEQFLSGQAFCFSKEQYIKEAMRWGIRYGLSVADVESHLNERSELRELSTRDGDIWYTTPEAVRIERSIFTSCLKSRGGWSATINEDHVDRYLNSQPENSSPSAEQREAVRFIATSLDRYIAVQGLAGVGKTFMLNHARAILEQHGYVVRGAAFTGKAAEGMAIEGGVNAQTIHSFLNQLEREAGIRSMEKDPISTDWNLEHVRPRNNLVVFVDEASMIDNKLMERLCRAVDKLQAKVVFLGDKHQLQPIGAGNAFAAMMDHDLIRYVTLEDIRRQQNEPLKNAVRELVKGEAKNAIRLLSNQVHVIENKTERLTRLVDDFVSQDPDRMRNSIILTGQNKDRTRINDMVREHLIQSGYLGESITCPVQGQNGGVVREKEFAVNDRIMFLKNDKRYLGVMNGTVGTIVAIEGETLQVRVQDRIICVNSHNYNRFDHAYAMTTHKAQGISIDRAFIHAPSTQQWANSRNAFYVNVSRAKHGVRIYTDDMAAVQKQAAKFQVRYSSLDFPESADEILRSIHVSKRAGLLKTDELHPSYKPDPLLRRVGVGTLDLPSGLSRSATFASITQHRWEKFERELE